MQVKDLTVKAERLDEIRGGADVSQYISNGATFGASAAFGGGVNSPTSSSSTVLSGHTNSQSASVQELHERITAYSVIGSQNVAIVGGFSPLRAKLVR